jgi:hypothetical protein
MGEAAGQLRGKLAFVGLGQRGAGLRLFGDVGGQEVDAVDRLLRVDLVGREGGTDAAAGGRFGEFQDARLACQCTFQRRPETRRHRAERVLEAQAHDVVAPVGQERGEPPVGEGVDAIDIDMADMGGRHLGRQTGARLHLGQFALGFLQLGDCGLQPAVGVGQLLGMFQKLVAQHLGAAAQQLLLPLDGGDVGIDRHPSAPGQGRALDRDRPPVGAPAFHVVGHEGAGRLHPVADEGRGIVHVAVFAGIDEVADRLLEPRSGGHELLRQSEHRLERPVADGEPQIPVIDRQGLLDQVQTRARQMAGIGAARHSLLPRFGLPFRSDARLAASSTVSGTLLQFVRFAKKSGKT